MKKILIIFIVIFATTETNAQSLVQSYTNRKDKFSLGYEVCIPDGKFVKETSWAGGRIDYKRMISNKFSVGIGGSWNSFEDYVAKTTYQKPDGTGALTTDLIKQIYAVPITLTGNYYFTNGKHLLPYVGLGLGTQYCDQTLYFNIYAVSEDNWGFVARPEIGVIYPFTSTTGVYLNAAYNYATNSNDAVKSTNFSHVAISIGFIFGD